MNRSEFNLAQWLQWMLDNHPTEIDLGLQRVGQVFKQMDLDLSATKLISIAGTNGKGSTTALLESIYLEQGYSTLAYTSPHLQQYNERVRINGSDTIDQHLIDAFYAIDQAQQGVSLSYFEIGTLAALWLVAELKPQVALLEVGLGGRLDAVNVVDADVAAITTLDLDHIDWLGDDIEQIGLEKAGIARPGRPLVCGEFQPPNSIAKFSADNDILLYQANDHFSLKQHSEHWDWQGLDASGHAVLYKNLPLPNLPLQNASTALQVLQMAALPCDESVIVRGIEKARAKGRQQVVAHRGVDLLLDVAHNRQSAAFLAKSLQAQQDLNNVHFILGVLEDKDCESLINALKPLAKRWHLVPLDVPRGQTAEVLEQRLLSQDVDSRSVYCYAGMGPAIDAVVQQYQQGERVVIAGSFFTVSDALEIVLKD